MKTYFTRSSNRGQLDAQDVPLREERYYLFVDLLGASGCSIDETDRAEGLTGHREGEIIVGRMVSEEGEPLDHYIVEADLTEHLDAVGEAENLDELLAALIDADKVCRKVGERLEYHIDMSSLPFWGPAPEPCPEGIWSYDETRLLVGEGPCSSWGIEFRLETGYHADNGDHEEYFPDAESGLEAAQEYVSSGEWGECTKTFWISVRTWRMVGGEECEEETHKITVEPEEPRCTEFDHDWKSSGVYGHGGGVVEKERCSHCGMIRISDSWDQDPVDGEQGLRSVEYREDLV